MKLAIRGLVFILLYLSAHGVVSAESPNPFLTGSKPIQKTEENRLDQKAILGIKAISKNRFFAKLTQMQRGFNTKITSVISDYRHGKSSELLLIVFSIALAYGFIHAMMPGHGKNIVLGWILASQKQFIKVMTVAAFGMALHVFSAIVMVYTIWFVVGGRFSSQSAVLTRYVSFLAFGILLLIALKQISSVFLKRTNHHSNAHHLGNFDVEAGWKECLLTAVGVGLIPCPVSTVLIVFMISQGFHLEGLLTGLFFAVGMAGTLLLFSATAWSMRSILLRKRGRLWGHLIDKALPVIGSILMVVSGLVIIAPYI